MSDLFRVITVDWFGLVKTVEKSVPLQLQHQQHIGQHLRRFPLQPFCGGGLPNTQCNVFCNLGEQLFGYRVLDISAVHKIKQRRIADFQVTRINAVRCTEQSRPNSAMAALSA